MDFNKSIPIKKPKINLLLILGIDFLLVIAFLIVVPTKTITENVEVPYLDQETYYVQEAYDVQEPYEVQEAYQAEEPYQTLGFYLDTQPYTTIDAPSGSHFEIDLDEKTADGCDCSGWKYDITHPTGVICVQKKCKIPTSVEKYGMTTKYRTVTKYGTVTKYRTVTKYQDVPKIRDVTKTRIETRHFEVNFILETILLFYPFHS